MLDNYYTLAALVKELRPTLLDAVIVSVFSQEKNAVDIVFAKAIEENYGEAVNLLHSEEENFQSAQEKEYQGKPPPGSRIPLKSEPSRERNEKLGSIKISFRRGNRFVVLSSGSRKAKKNTADLFEGLGGEKIQSIQLLTDDRIIQIGLSDGSELSLYLFGSKANLFLSRNGIISASYKQHETWKGHSLPQTTRRQAPSRSSEMESSDKDDARQLFPNFPRTLIDELEARNEASGRPLGDLGEEMVTSLNESEKALVYWNDDVAMRLSLIELTGMKDLRLEHFESVNKACRIVSGKRLRAQSFKQDFAPLRKKLHSSLAKSQRLEENLLKAMEEKSRAEAYQLWGDLLMSQPFSALKVDRAEIALEDFSDPTETHTIKLDPLQSFVENAKLYYQKAKSARAKRGHSQDRLPEIQKRIASLANLISEFDSFTSLKELRKFVESQKLEIENAIGHALSVFGFGKKLKSGEAESRFRRFEISSGYVVLVGKNAKQNDELTLQASSKEDIWMHARGYPGSHTILKTRGREDPPKSILEEAASIAAHFSKGRSSSLVPVAYTRRKYVSKPKGSAAGSVRLSQEKVILVEPKLGSG